MIFFYTHIDVLLLIFCRIIFALSFLPIIVETKLPPAARVGLALALTAITFLVMPPTTLQYSPQVLSFFLLVFKEILVGLIMSFGIMFFFQVYYFVGHMWSMQGGLGMSTLFDPVGGAQVPLLGKFYYLGFCAVFTLSGGYHWFIRALVESFQHIPVGQAVFTTGLVGTIVDAMATLWVLSFKLASPILAVIFIVDCGLGILARTVPQMNMFVIGLPLKLMLLFYMLIVIMSLLPAFNALITNEIVNLFYNLVQGLRAG
ncbi:MAG: flagellar biosynthetic protein FliR [Cellulosilyticaceae bacterium]